MICSISGEIPTVPVVSKLTGHIYESNLIKKAISTSGKCPITGKPLSEDDLIQLQLPKVVTPPLVSSLSIPGLLSSLQNEWDDMMLTTYQLKSALDSTRQELAQALYQHDAACRVIARLMKERDEATYLLSHQSELTAINSATIASSTQMDVDEEHKETVNNSFELAAHILEEPILTVCNDTCKMLSSHRKSRKISPSLSSKESVTSFYTAKSFDIHASGVSSLAISKDSKLISGSVSGDISIHNIAEKSAELILKISASHESKVTGVACHPDISVNAIISSSDDKSLKVWKAGALACAFIGHEDVVTSLSLHPSGEYFISGSADSKWNLWNLPVASSDKSCLVRSINAGSSVASAKFHPDGLILGTGVVNSLKLWDLREQSLVGVLDHPSSTVTSIAFNENGYLLSSSSSDGTIRVWDLRKLKQIKSLGTSSSSTSIYPCNFDESGTYLSFAQPNHSLQVVVVKEYNNLWEANNLRHESDVTSLIWGPDASFIVTSSLDGTVKYHSK